jgi:hypothetical protein
MEVDHSMQSSSKTPAKNLQMKKQADEEENKATPSPMLSENRNSKINNSNDKDA